MNPAQTPSAAPRTSLLGGLRADDLLRRATRRTGSGSRMWEPPPVEELAALLPDFRIEALAGRGGMGAVYAAWQTALERRVAIKLLAPALTEDDLFRDRFRREARLLARLAHPGIVTVYETGETADGQLYYVMEYVDGTDLARHIDGGRLPWMEGVDILRQMAEALAHAHAAGVVHRDVKPSNVLLTAGGRVKVADFGLAAPREPGHSQALTLTGTALGTVEYAAPEQMEGGAVDHRADIFSLGVIGYELLTGVRPRGAFDPASRFPDVNWRFDDVITRALQRDPAQRQQSVEEFAARLARAADEALLASQDEELMSVAEIGALEEFYRRHTADISPEARRFVEEELITASGFRDSRALEDALAKTGVTREALDLLVSRRLLRLTERRGGLRVEIAHDRIAGVIRALRDTRREEELLRDVALLRQKTESRLRRRNRLVIGFALLTIAALAGAAFTFLKSKEIARQAESARLTRAGAEELVEFMLGKLQGNLFEANRLDVLDDVVRKVEAYYVTVPPEEQRDDEFLRRKAEFLELKGALLARQNRAAEAMAAYQEAQAIRRPLLEKHPAESKYLGPWIEGQVAVANALQGVRDFAGAYAAYEEMIGIETNSHHGKLDPATAQTVCLSRAIQADLLRAMGKTAEAAALNEAGLAQMDKLLLQPEMDAQYGFHNVKAVHLRGLASAAGENGDFARAVECASQEAAIHRRFLPKGKRHGYRERMLAGAEHNLGEWLTKAEKLPAAEEHFVLAHALSSRLQQEGPVEPGAVDRETSAGHAWSALRRRQNLSDSPDILKEEGKAALVKLATAPEPDPAPAAKASGLWDALTANPENEEAQSAWAKAVEAAGRELEATTGVAAALAYYKEMLAQLEAPLNSAAPDSWWNLSVSAVLNRIAALEEQADDSPAAESSYRRSLTLRKKLLAGHRDNAMAARNTVSSAMHLARVLVAAQRAPEAAAVMAPLLHEMKPLPRDAATAWRSWLANSAGEVVAALDSDAARSLSVEAQAFLLAAGPEESLSEDEKASLAALRAAVAR